MLSGASKCSEAALFFVCLAQYILTSKKGGIRVEVQIK
ncbi:hypothetical protein J2736_000884 [Paenibacillus qinlingensis]|uniref:Uncharacterized protein n=1 Tax=Paenibacillus qinlingensis TaxID=1837343 RepID=A0ABU1NQE9_9BACL|nr:hypothetical protein [Paenibacillus qinlingensis]